MESILKILHKLDFTALKEEEKNQDEQSSSEIVSSNPVNGFKPSKPKDFEILVNLVDFSRDLLSKNYEKFDKWTLKLSKEVILLSSRNPLISSFYKLNTLIMKISVKNRYFEVISTLRFNIYF